VQTAAPSPGPLDRLAVAAAQKIKERDYWLNRLADEPEPTVFPYDHKDGDSGNRRLDTVTFRLSQEPFYRLMKLGSGSDSRLHMILTAALSILLKKYTRKNDILVGTTVVKQKRALTDLINTVLVLRSELRDDMTFKELLRQTRQTVTEAVENQNYPFEILLKQLNLSSANGESPLFDVGILVENIHSREYFRDIKPAVTFLFSMADDYLAGELEYNARWYERATMERMACHFTTLLEAVLFDVDIKLSAVNILPGRERKQILYEFNDTRKEIGRDRCFFQLFEEQVARGPDRKAAVEAERHLTYNGLNEEANRIAGFLSRHGVSTDAVVAIFMRRSIKMLSSIMGTFKAGGAYLALEIDYPEERVKDILRDSGVEVLIGEPGNREAAGRLKEQLPRLQTLLCLDHDEEAGMMLAESGAAPVGPDSLAYIIYTSGTTGKPKGAVIHQLGMLNHFYGNIRFLNMTESDIIAQTASVYSDISVWQFLVTAMVGGATLIIEKEIVLDPGRMLHVLRKGKVTILQHVPSWIRIFLEIVESQESRELKYLRWMIPCGETLTAPVVGRWYENYPDIKLVNAYGPAEASDDVSLCYVGPVYAEGRRHMGNIPVGRPLENLHIYILDGSLKLCPVGVRGEICVAGVGVGKGYLNNPGKTAASFVPNPCLRDIGGCGDYAVLYRTGDMGYYTGDGEIIFLGRIDHQVKVRGFRVELQEIEGRLVNIGEIEEAVVLAKGEGADKYLCAYIVSGNSVHPSVSKLREILSVDLPDYMIPAYFTFLDKIPLGPNGKIDRKALPEPGVNAGKEYIGPRDEVEERLVKIWAEILKVKEDMVGIDFNFFQLGGNSLKATIMAARIHREFDVMISLGEIFRNPTIEGTASLIRVIGWAEQEQTPTGESQNQDREEMII
jgi:amino acid adenylation domain-containing protein